MADIQFACQSCRAKLRLSNPALTGKKIKCPKCGAVTQVPVPEEPAEEEIAEAALAPPPPPARKRPESVTAAPKKAAPKKAPPPDDEDDDEPAPPKKGKKAPPPVEDEGDEDERPRKKKKARAGGAFSPLLIGACGAGALVVLLLALFVLGVFDGKSPAPIAKGPGPKPGPIDPGPGPGPIDPGPGDSGGWPLKPLDAAELAARAQLREQNRQARAAEEAKWVEARLAAGEKAPFAFGPFRKGAARSPGELRFSPAGALVALQGTFEGTEVWDLATGKLLWEKEDKGLINGTAPVFSPDGALLVTALREGAELRDARTGQVRAALKGHDGGVAAAAFSPDGKTLTTVSFGSDSPQTDVRVWDVSSPGAGKKLPPRFGVAHRLALSPDGRLLATHVNLGFATKVWDLHAGREVWSASLGHDANDLKFSPDGKYLAIGTTGDKRGPFKVIEVETGATRVQYQTPDGLGTRSAFSPDGTRLLVVHAIGDADLWDVAAGKRLRELKGYSVGRPVDISPGGALVVLAPQEWSFGIWTIEGLK